MGYLVIQIRIHCNDSRYHLDSRTELITKAAKIEFMLILKVLDALALGFSKLFGIVSVDKD